MSHNCLDVVAQTGPAPFAWAQPGKEGLFQEVGYAAAKRGSGWRWLVALQPLLSKKMLQQETRCLPKRANSFADTLADERASERIAESLEVECAERGLA